MTDAAIASPSEGVSAPAPASEAPATTADVTPLGDRPISNESSQEAKPVKVEVVDKAKPKTSLDSLKEAANKVNRNEKDRMDRAAAKEGVKPDAKADAAKVDDKGKPIAAETKPADKPKYEPPTRWTPTAKAKWESLDDEIKAETDRTVKELEKGLNQYKSKVDDLKEFEDIATKHGTTLKNGLKNYVAIDLDLQSSDPARKLKALDAVFAAAKVDKGEFARFILGQAQDATTQPVPQNQEVASLKQEIAQLRQQIAGTTETVQTQQRTQIENHIAQWAKDKPLAETLAPQIAQHVGAGMSLDDAYAKAVSTQQEIAKAMGFILPAAAPAPSPKPQPLKGEKSITGAPSPGSYQGTGKPSSSNAEAVRRAMEAAGISL